MLLWVLFDRTMNTNHIYIHVFVENSVTKDPERRKPWKRDREQSQGFIEVDTGFIMPFRFKTFSVNRGAETIDVFLIYVQTDATLHSLFIYGNCSTCFGWYLHPSSGEHTTVSTASGTCQTVTATCRCRGR